jgi:phosphate transport system ATP-binding protein
MNDLIPGARVEGESNIAPESVWPDIDAVEVRRRIGMVFQKPIPFPEYLRQRGVRPRVLGIRDRRALDQIVEQSLRQGRSGTKLRTI